MILYHWSPMRNRNSINKLGLVPGRRAITYSIKDGDDESFHTWRAPYVCLAEDPIWAWALSGDIAGKRHESWDLWCANVDPKDYEVKRLRHYSDETHPTKWHEVRVHGRIYKRNVMYVATRVIK